MGIIQGKDVRSLVGQTDIFPDQTGFPWQVRFWPAA